MRDAKLRCPMCDFALKTDEHMLWCENAACDFHGLFGELIYEGKLKLPKGKRKKSKKEQTKELMGVGFIEPRGSAEVKVKATIGRMPGH